MAYRRKTTRRTTSRAAPRRSYSTRAAPRRKTARRKSAPKAQVIKIQFSHVPMQQQSIPLMGQDGQLVQLAKPNKKDSKL